MGARMEAIEESSAGRAAEAGVRASLCVLASSSSGNCSALLVERGAGDRAEREVYLFDLGLSPRRTRGILAELGWQNAPLAGVLLTHLDHDHVHAGWLSALPERTTVHLHRRHLPRAERGGLAYWRLALHGDRDGALGAPIALCEGVEASPLLATHDELGSVVFRVEFPLTGHALGYATDVGHVSDDLLAHLRGVDVLAIESNYCPILQADSPRPAVLKQRITGGHGHLSNQQSAAAVRAIAPGRHVVLLHLSRECNSPDIALAHHRHRDVAMTVAGAEFPTEVIAVAGAGLPRSTPPEACVVRTPVARTLWG
jgi:phosphoribosyl 1,2-cyclic phosphodiesterase